eukprot:2010109-Pyramimonas_sp.AAC.1
MEAFYAAHEADPSNEYVIQAIEDGYQDCLILKAATPEDVLKYVKEEHSGYHVGLGQNHIEKYEAAVQAVEPAWRVECDTKSYTVQSCPKKGPFSYASLYAEFVKTKFKQMFPEWEPFDNAKAFWHKMESLKLDTWYKDVCERKCDFMHRDFDVNYVLNLNNAIKSTIFMKQFTDLFTADVLAAAMKELLQFGFPTDPHCDKTHALEYPFLLTS